MRTSAQDISPPAVPRTETNSTSFGAAKRTRFFAGVEAGYVSSSASGSAYKVAGPLAGAVAGVEFRVLRRLAVGLDAGPYLFALHEKSTAASQTSADFVFNSSLSFFLF